MYVVTNKNLSFFYVKWGLIKLTCPHSDILTNLSLDICTSGSILGTMATRNMTHSSSVQKVVAEEGLRNCKGLEAALS